MNLRLRKIFYYVIYVVRGEIKEREREKRSLDLLKGKLRYNKIFKSF